MLTFSICHIFCIFLQRGNSLLQLKSDHVFLICNPLSLVGDIFYYSLNLLSGVINITGYCSILFSLFLKYSENQFDFIFRYFLYFSLFSWFLIFFLYSINSITLIDVFPICSTNKSKHRND